MMWVINDIHLGVTRSAGTTLKSQAALADWQFEMFERLLGNREGTVIVNGDLFDRFDIDNGTLLRAYRAFSSWLSGHLDNRLVLVAGNHDLAKDSSKVSAFKLLASLLIQHSASVQIVMGHGQTLHDCEDVYVIPHVTNQDLFDLELEQVPPTAKFVLLHCNYDNHFAEQADHSLNLSPEQAEKLPGFIVLGHEHQQRFALDERVVIVGNQIPTSVADCLGPRFKYLARLDLKTQGVELVPVLQLGAVFARVDWRNLAKEDTATQFVRVEGEASAQEAADVVTAIAKFRARSDAFVVANAVKIEGASVMAGVLESLEDARSINVIEAILALLDDKERAIVHRLMGTTEC